MTFPLFALALVGCKFDEGIIIEDMPGTLVVHRDAATVLFGYDDGSSETVTDVRNIGPVFVGLYPGVSDTLLSYPHPEMGPIIEPGIPGDTYPYGGTTIGDVRFACVADLTCKMVSGRHADYQSIIDWFGDVVQSPVEDASGVEVTSGEWLKQECYDQLHVTSDAEVRITAYEDRNDDGQINEQDLDFVERSDGHFEANFMLWQMEMFEGMVAWAFMDRPSEVDLTLTTCDPGEGFHVSEYNADFYGGTFYEDILNFPSERITPGDWVTTEGVEWTAWDLNPEIWIDFPVEQ